MKNRYFLPFVFFIVFIVLTGCKSNADLENPYNPETDYQYLYHRQGELKTMADSGSGYYFLNGTRIYYADKDDMKPVLLDSRPDADNIQQDENKWDNSSFSNGEFLTFYNEKLYMLERGEMIFSEESQTTKEPIYLIEVSKDGTDRKTILTLDSYPYSIAIHRGVVYYTVRDFSKYSALGYHIMKYDFKKRFFNNPEIMYTGDISDGQIIDLMPYGNNVYFLEMGHLEDGSYVMRLMRYDIEEETTTQIVSDDNFLPNIQGFLNDKLILNIYDGDRNLEEEWFAYTSDLDGNNLEELPIDINFLSHFYLDSNYLYVRPVWAYLNLEKYKHIPDEMVIYDWDYQIVDTVDMSYYRGMHKLISGDDEYMFIFYTKDYSTYYIDYLDKKEIGSGNLEFKNLIES